MADITIVGVPDTVTEAEVMEWVTVLIERKEQAKLNPPEDKVLAAQALVDTFRSGNGLEKKYDIVKEK